MRSSRRSPDHRFYRDRRLTTAKQFDNVFKNADIDQRVGPLRVRSIRNSCPVARLGLVVSKRVLPRAVDRNFVKRTIREWFRTVSDQIEGVDIVVTLRSAPKTRCRLRELTLRSLEQWFVAAANRESR